MTALVEPEPTMPETFELSDDLFDSLPDLPSLDGYEARLASIQAALDEARAEASAIRAELAHKADLLRRLAIALETV